MREFLPSMLGKPDITDQNELIDEICTRTALSNPMIAVRWPWCIITRFLIPVIPSLDLMGHGHEPRRPPLTGLHVARGMQ